MISVLMRTNGICHFILAGEGSQERQRIVKNCEVQTSDRAPVAEGETPSGQLARCRRYGAIIALAALP
jgi:hypothetical protein